MEDYLMLHKEVDMSILREGFSIPVAFQQIFFEKLGFRIKRGESIPIKILIDGTAYDVLLKNMQFDEVKYPGHPDVLQIRYSPGSPFAAKLQSIFQATMDRVEAFRLTRTDKKKLLVIPEDQKEFFVLYATPTKGILLGDCITNAEYVQETREIQQTDERTFESAIDDSAAIITRIGQRKIRKLSKAIGDNLKIVYQYRCQICGASFNAPYGSHLIHAHHIDYFTQSLNNNANNIMIVCPNHHGIIHDLNPVFDREKKSYLYPNGYREGLLLNQHI